MISVCVPTRGRPKMFGRMLASAKRYATGPFEVVAYIDDDDATADQYPAGPTYVRGPRVVQSDMWNLCWEHATGDVAMLGGDDMLFDSPKWNAIVQNHFDAVPDRLLMVFANDGTARRDATLPFVSREWIDVAGTFTPPYFKSWMADRWIWEIAEMLNRDIYIDKVRIKHPNVAQRKRIDDQTYRDGQRFRDEQDPKLLYVAPHMLAERCEQALRLSRAIAAGPSPRWP